MIKKKSYMYTYNKIFELAPLGTKEVVEYVCRENPRVSIKVERGSILHNRPTGYTICFDGKVDQSKWLISSVTLKEAKEMAEYYYPLN